LAAIGAGVAIQWQGVFPGTTEARVNYLLGGPSVGTYGNYWLSDDAKKEVRDIGIDAIPCLLRELDRTSRPSKVDYFMWSHPGIPGWIRSRYLPRRERALHVASAFEALGPVAAVAVPDLVRRVARPQTAHYAARCLMSIHPAPKGAVLDLVIDVKSANASVRSAAAMALIEIDQEAAHAAGLL